MAVSMPGLAFGGRAEDCRHVVVALDVCLLGEVQIAAVGLTLTGERRFEVLLGLGILQCRHPSLHCLGNGTAQRGAPRATDIERRQPASID